ncbi:putative exoribonuclease [Cafeteria roenbergensis virus]|uniref:Putative exoribonuclease n=1 Tax=Cafeteria roenbergensis virus (strain BV-PW1) TaxID=693272 RepID=E3T5F8_CROVB|nr:putative exoribonuclease [Cafeteria roenbergensis virus BV-PW1]ADO67421.1 putative exoribonuclease [Cafeteria roenbergensis virus BV-PW1]
MLLIGFFNTYDSIKYGIDKKKRPYYGFTPLYGKFQKVKITYSGKQKGKLLCQIIVNDINNNFPTGQIINLIGTYSTDNILNLLKLDSEQKYLPSEININNKIILDEYKNDFVTIDPENSSDIDDGFYLNYPQLDVIIACPFYFLNKTQIIEKYKQSVSTRYYSQTNHLWGNELNQKASLLQNNKTVLMVLHYCLINYTYQIKFYQGTNKHQLTYEQFDTCTNYNKWKELLKKHFNFTNSKELVQEIMILTNKKFTDFLELHQAPILYRKFIINHNFDIYNLDKNIKDIFNQRKSDSAEYTLIKSSHELLKGCYSHFTSPLRRWVDCYHQMLLWQIIHNQSILENKLDIILINHKFTKIKKFHREYQYLIQNQSLNINDLLYNGFIFNIRKNYLDVWCPEINRFIKVEFIHQKLLFQLNIIQKEHSWEISNKIYSDKNIIYSIGDKITFYLIKSGHILPSKYIMGKLDNNPL